MAKPRVSIVIPFYNDPYIGEAIESALRQTYIEKEIIVVNDGSTRNAELIKPYRSRIHYIQKANGGTASALNAGIKQATGTYIAWLSSDDRYYAHKLAVQVQYMIERNAYISHTNFDLIDGNGHITEMAAGMRFAKAIDFYRSFFVGNVVNGCTIVMKRDLLKRIGLFNEQLTYTHDLDLWYRIMLAGYDFHYVPEQLTAYRRHEAMGTIKHEAAIAVELRATNERYYPAMEQFISRAFGV